MIDTSGGQTKNNLFITSQNTGKRLRNQLTTEQYFNLYYKSKVPPVDLYKNYYVPDEVCIMVFNRMLKIRDKHERLIKRYEPVFFS